MKLPKSLKVKETTSLYSNKFCYKVVIVTPFASFFRRSDAGDLKLKLLKLDRSKLPSFIKIKSPEDISYAVKICEVIEEASCDHNIRIESPYLNFYCSDSLTVELLVNVDPSQIKYITIPFNTSPTLSENTVIVKKLDFDYKVTMGRTRKDHCDFLDWALKSDKIKLTKKIKKDLTRSNSWGGGYFYVKGEKTLTMVRMFLGSNIAKTETVLKG